MSKTNKPDNDNYLEKDKSRKRKGKKNKTQHDKESKWK